MNRSQGLSRKPLKRTQPRRDWSAAREKVETEGWCRVCGNIAVHPVGLEAAHIIGREHDKQPATFVVWQPGLMGWKPYNVDPIRIVPLCGRHHQAYDAHELDLLGYLTPQEEAQAVLDAGGLENARRRLAPSAYRRSKEERDERTDDKQQPRPRRG